jgi:hypothetical protein
VEDQVEEQIMAVRQDLEILPLLPLPKEIMVVQQEQVEQVPEVVERGQSAKINLLRKQAEMAARVLHLL